VIACSIFCAAMHYIGTGAGAMQINNQLGHQLDQTRCGNGRIERKQESPKDPHDRLHRRRGRHLSCTRWVVKEAVF
jgi:hypothetical protein